MRGLSKRANLVHAVMGSGGEAVEKKSVLTKSFRNKTHRIAQINESFEIVQVKKT